MLKLYDFTGQAICYWESWEHDGELVLHWGTVGDRGETSRIFLEPGESPDAVIAQLAEPSRLEGFRELNEGEAHTLIVQFRLEGWGSADDLQKRHEIEDALNESLGWTGNGECDGGDIGSGTMNIWCYVVDPLAAVQTALQELSKRDWLDGSIIAHARGEDDFVVAHPPDFTGVFSSI